MVEKLFEKFIREKLYLSNVSKKTAKFYLDCQRAYLRTVGDALPTKDNLKEFVIRLQESGIKPTTVNVYIRGINSWLTWMLENEHIIEKYRLKQLKVSEKVLKVFSDEQIRLLLSYKPKNFFDHRLYAMVCLAIDSGARIDELITLTRDKLDLENLLVTLRGKGDKERIVPISIECRKELYRFLKRHDFNFVFPSKGGGKLYYHNTYRDFKALCSELGISGVRCSWHTLRHGYALNHIREGGDVFSLQRLLGHTDLDVTKRYVGLTQTDLQTIHKKVSILGRLK